MEQKNIKIKCSFCGKILMLKDEPGIDEKTTTCPVCKQKLRIGDCQRVKDRKEEVTEYPDWRPANEEKTEYHNPADSENTHVGKSPFENLTLGQLKVLPSGPSFLLRPGQNIVGRKVINPPHADFEIPTTVNRMSRQHLLVEVKKVPGKGFVHYASLYGQRANATFIGNNRLDVGDCLVLNDGDIILLPDQPDIRVKFEIPNEEKTKYD